MKILIATAAMLAALTSYPTTAPEAAAPIVYAVGATDHRRGHPRPPVGLLRHRLPCRRSAGLGHE